MKVTRNSVQLLRLTRMQLLQQHRIAVTISLNWTSDNPAEASKNIVAVLSRVLQRYSATNAEFADVDEIRNAGFTKDTKFTAHFIASDATTYKVEVYYEHEASIHLFRVRAFR